MTAIAGIADGQTVWLAGDSARTAGGDVIIGPEPKVFTCGPYVFGARGTLRFAQLLRYAFQPPAPCGDLPAFMSTTFVTAWQACLKDAGCPGEEGGFLAGVSGRLFTIWQAGGVTERDEGYDAVGCGKNYVLGSLFTTADDGLGPQARLEIALRAAERFCTDVAGPFRFTRTPEVTS